jgi:hypothetical protein
LYIIPEDEADEELANGFVMHHQVREAVVQVMPPAGGFGEVLNTFLEEYVPKLRKYPEAHVVMLIDFDDHFEDRLKFFKAEIDQQFDQRVFVIGSKYDPEKLKKAIELDCEEIGNALARDCDDGTTSFWEHEHLRHNNGERERLVQMVKEFLFKTT